MVISDIIKKLESKKDLDKNDLSNIVHEFEEKRINSEDIKKLVLAWREKKESTSELFNLAEIINNKQNQSNKYKDTFTLDMCGTGGDKLNTFNISTISAIVASLCGLKVIKHSGRSTTSVTGSVDILSHFGINIDLSKEVREKCFEDFGLMFVSSKVLRDVFGDVKKVSKEINIPGFVNLLGPLTNPYNTSHQILGVSSFEWGNLLANVLKLQKRNALVICSKINESTYMDELSFCGTNYTWHIEQGKIKEEKFEPKDLGQELVKVNLNDLIVKDISESKAVFEAILRGTLKSNDPKVSVIALNLGAAIYLAKKVKTLRDGYDLALEHIQSGKAWEQFQHFINCIKKDNVK